MKKTMLMMLGLAAVVFVGANAHAVEVKGAGNYLEFTPSLSAKGKTFGSALYLNTTLKVGESWTVTPETLLNFTHVTASKSDMGMTLGFVRFLVGGPVLKKWSEKTSFKLEYRVTPGIHAGYQQAGTIAAFAVRPVYVADLGNKFGLMVRGLTQLNLQRNAYQIYRPVNGEWKGAKGNGILAFAPEFLVSYDITEKVGISTYWSPSFVITGPAKGSDDTTLAKGLAHEQAIGYSVNDALTVSAKVSEETVMGTGFKLFDASKLAYGLEVGYKY